MNDQESTCTRKGCITCGVRVKMAVLFYFQSKSVLLQEGMVSVQHMGHASTMGYSFGLWALEWLCLENGPWKYRITMTLKYMCCLRRRKHLSLCVHNTTHTDTQAMLKKESWPSTVSEQLLLPKVPPILKWADQWHDYKSCPIPFGSCLPSQWAARCICGKWRQLVECLCSALAHHMAPPTTRLVPWHHCQIWLQGASNGIKPSV